VYFSNNPKLLNSQEKVSNLGQLNFVAVLASGFVIVLGSIS
jgi:hypothetical protein